MPRDDNSVRDAGAAIARSGLTDDVIATGGRDPSQRQNRHEDDSRDVERKPKRQQARRQERDDDHDYGDGDTFGGDEDEGYEADDGSNRDSGDTDDDGEPDEGEDDASQSEGDDDEPEGEDDQDPEEATHKVKVQGRELEVTLRELKAGYQRNRDYQIKTHTLAKHTRELTAGHQAKAEEYGRNLVTLNHITSGLRKLIVGDMDGAEMRQLRATNPTLWNEQRAQMTEKVEMLDQIIGGLKQEATRHLTGVSERQKADLKTLAAAEGDKLIAVIPNWFTPDREGEKSGSRKVHDFLVGVGFTSAEVQDVHDSRMFIVADKARRYDELMNRQKNGKRRGGKMPKTVKPGQTQIRKQTSGGRDGANSGGFKKAAAQAKKTGSTRDAGAAIARLIKS